MDRIWFLTPKNTHPSGSVTRISSKWKGGSAMLSLVEGFLALGFVFLGPKHGLRVYGTIGLEVKIRPLPQDPPDEKLRLEGPALGVSGPFFHQGFPFESGAPIPSLRAPVFRKHFLDPFRGDGGPFPGTAFEKSTGFWKNQKPQILAELVRGGSLIANPPLGLRSSFGFFSEKNRASPSLEGVSCEGDISRGYPVVISPPDLPPHRHRAPFSSPWNSRTGLP